MNNPRYHGKPTLRLLECYVLKAIGALSPADAENLAGMQPKLAQIYSASGTWDQIIASSMHLPANMPVLIQNMWHKHQQTAAEQNIPLTPQHFAEMFVDHNLAPQDEDEEGEDEEGEDEEGEDEEGEDEEGEDEEEGEE